MIKTFNAFQIVVLYTCMPYLVGWLYKNPFPYSIGLFWSAIAAYVIMFGFMILAMYNLIEDTSK